MLHVHDYVLQAAQRAASGRSDWTFTIEEVVRTLPRLNASTIRTHVVSRCCVNAPKNHLHKWPYFRRVARGRYQIEENYRANPKQTAAGAHGASGGGSGAAGFIRKNLHAIIQHDEGAYVVECLELPIVSQGGSLDEAVANFREAVSLHLEGEDLSTMGLSVNPDLQMIYEISAA